MLDAQQGKAVPGGGGALCRQEAPALGQATLVLTLSGLPPPPQVGAAAPPPRGALQAALSKRADVCPAGPAWTCSLPRAEAKNSPGLLATTSEPGSRQVLGPVWQLSNR